MRDREHLMIGGQRTQRVTDLLTDATADARIDLVEDQCRYTLLRCLRARQRQHDPRQLATTRDSRQRPRVVTRIQCDAKLDIFVAGRSRFITRWQCHEKTPFRQPERRQQRRHRLGQMLRRAATRSSEC